MKIVSINVGLPREISELEFVSYRPPDDYSHSDGGQLYGSLIMATKDGTFQLRQAELTTQSNILVIHFFGDRYNDPNVNSAKLKR